MTKQTAPLSVSQLNRQIRNLLELDVGKVHVEGEISNLSKPSSGHFYFTLKDKNAQLRCVYFKTRHNKNSTLLTNGQHIVVSGSLSLYEARGDFQLIVDSVSEAGLGQLYQQFELLKKKLESEGLFQASLKKPLPKFPKQIAVITSPSGAAIRDILTTLNRRYPIAKVIIYPCDVQGNLAAPQLTQAVNQAALAHETDVILLARGGGSIEDLWAFNDEALARAIAACPIPVVSGVGHETDFTIADFVADLRAATPTAAAEAVSPDRFELINLFNQLYQRLYNNIHRKIQGEQQKLQHQQQKMASPGKLILSHWQSLDYLEKHLNNSFRKIHAQKTHQLHLNQSKLQAQNPRHQLQQNQYKLSHLHQHLLQCINEQLQQQKNQLNAQCKTLHAVSPLATLDRGYAIATSNKKILFSSEQVKTGDTIDVRLSKGHLTCGVIQTGG